jgi:hypothetical protein
LTEISFRSRFQILATEESVSGKESAVFSSLEEVPDSSRYLPHVEERPPSSGPEKFLEALGFPPDRTT